LKTIKIGSQVWTKKNLKEFKFRNGDAIPIVQDNEEWSKLQSAAVCINPDNEECYYNWYAVSDPRGLAPEGFHVPSDEEWKELVNGLGDVEVAYQRLKSKKKGGFNASPAGYRKRNGSFTALGNDGYWWSSSPNGEDAIYRNLYSGGSSVCRYSFSPRFGFSVRCIQD